MKLKDKIKRFWTLDVHNHEGFTLVELIIVIAILAILSAVAVVGYSAYVEKANKSADEALIYEINQAFRAACIENFCDVYEVEAAKAEIKNGTVEVSNVKVNGAVNSDIAADFATYFDASNVVLKYYKYIVFDPNLCQFKGSMEMSNFGDEAVLDEMKNALNGIGGYFSAMATMGMTAEDLEAYLTNGVSDELAEALGLSGMADGLGAAMEAMSDAEIEAYLQANVTGYNDLTDDEKAQLVATVRGNLAVLHFAEQAKTADIAKVKSSVENFRSLLMAAYTNSGNVSYDAVKAYYYATLSAEDKAWFDGLTDSEEETAVNNFRNGTAAQMGDLSLTGAQLTAMEAALEQTSGNTAGINMLGSLYALAAGFYNSDYYQGEPEDIPPYTDFGCVMGAMADPNYEAYYAAQGEADLEYYLNYMGSLNQDNINLANPDAFGGNNN